MPRPLIPSGEVLFQGITLNEFSGSIDFGQLKSAGVGAVILRATAGDDYTDARVRDYAAQAQSAQLRIGFYHYLTAQDDAQAARQAQFFANTLSGLQYSLRPAMRFESLSGLGIEAANSIADRFLSALQAALSVTPIVYTDATSANLLWNRSIASNYPLWVIDETDAAEPSAGDSHWAGWTGWQYARRNDFDGAAASVPISRFTGGMLKSQIVLPEPDIEKPQDDTKLICLTVAYGDTLSAIARLFGLTVNEIAALNGIDDPDRIFPGQRLYLRVKSTVPYACCDRYLVRRGDTLSRIASRFNTTYRRIAAINELPDPDLILPGQEIKLGLCPAN